MNEQMSGWTATIIVMLVFGGVFLFVTMAESLAEATYKHGYEQGQIDALNGKWKYEVVVKPDTTYIAKPE